MSEAPESTSHDATQAESARSVSNRPLSRRVLMKAAALAPILAAGRRAWAAPTQENLAAFAKTTPIPPDQIEKVKTKAKVDAPGIDETEFLLVVRILWAHFQYGAEGTDFEPSFEPKLLETMYDTKCNDHTRITGAVLAQNVKLGVFDPFGNDYRTNVCAYLCGYKAAKLAKQQSKKIDKKIYEDARAAVETEMTAMLVSLRAQPQGGSSRRLGFGC